MKWFVLLFTIRFYLHVDAGHIHDALTFLSIYKMPSLNSHGQSFYHNTVYTCLSLYLVCFYMVETCSFLKNFLNNGKSRTNTCTDNCMLCAMPIMINRNCHVP